MTFDQVTRRRLLQGAGTAALAGLVPQRAFAADTVVGFVYVGSRDDYGYNQAHAAGAAALPVEFTLMDTRPAPWRAEDVVGADHVLETLRAAGFTLRARGRPDRRPAN